MPTKYVIGNWKLNGSVDSNRALVTDCVKQAEGLSGVQIAVCPTYLHIADVSQLISGSNIQLGAQNVSDQQEGAFTAEVSASMLAEYKCQYTIIGHSERRHVYGETQSTLNQKVAQALEAGLTPVYCVGETLADRESEQTENVIAQQLDPVIEQVGIKAFENIIIAYEPVWAIGTGLAASSEQAQAVHAYIRERIAKQDAAVAAKLSILYGGSVKPANAQELFTQTDIDGGLIGGAALKANDFIAIAKAAVA